MLILNPQKGGSMNKLILSCFLLLVLLRPSAYSQQPVNLRNTHERVLCVVPMVGSGTAADPRRPMFAPVRERRGEKPSRDGIIAYSFQESDDGRFALVEFVALDRAAFASILEERDRRVDVKVFVKGEARKADIEAEFRGQKGDFDMERFRVNVP
jgi:hypothetical protein